MSEPVSAEMISTTIAIIIALSAIGIYLVRRKAKK